MTRLLLLALACWIATVPSLFYVLSGNEAFDPGGFAYGMAFLAAPFLVLAMFSPFLRAKVARAALAIAMVTVLGIWYWGWFSTFVEPAAPDAQAGLAVVVIPIYLAMAALVTGLAVLVVDRFVAR